MVGLFRTDDEQANDDALLNYGALGAYPVGPACLGLGAYGRWLATEDEGSFSDQQRASRVGLG